TLAGDLFNDATARIAAAYDTDPRFGAVYVSGAGTPQYPEMRYPRPTDCGVYSGTKGPAASLTTADFTWKSSVPTTNCTVPDPNPAQQANAWTGTYQTMLSQFTRSQLIGMLDVTLHAPKPNWDRSTTAMDQVLTQINHDEPSNPHTIVGNTGLSPR